MFPFDKTQKTEILYHPLLIFVKQDKKMDMMKRSTFEKRKNDYPHLSDNAPKGQ